VGLKLLGVLGGMMGGFEGKGRYRETMKSDLVAFRKRVERRRAKKGYS
jgi:hypothetical protein